MDVAWANARPVQRRKAGATFYKCALQVNPKGYAAQFRGETVEKTESYTKEIITKCLELKIQAIGITNHNDFGDVPEFQRLAAGSGITVFPGFELSSSEGVHLLCLYPPETQSEQLRLNLGNLGIARSGPSDDLSTMNLNQILSKVASQGGVAIAAHITNQKGLLCQLSGKPRAQAWKDENLLAAQIPGKPDDVPESFKRIVANADPEYKRPFPLAFINASDITAPQDLESPSASTLIKMGTPSIDGLRQAFREPGCRIRLNTQEELTRHTTLNSISWQGGFLDGVSIDLNENLNVLIGGRGSGKSTIIESLRYALDLPPFGEDAIKAHKGVVQSVLKSGTKITLHLSSPHPSQRDYVIERTIPNPPSVRSGGELLPLSPSDVAPHVEIFGQHEISEIAKSKENLTKLLQRFIDDGQETSERMSSLRRKLAQSRTRIIETQSELDLAKERLSALPALEEAQRRFDEAGLETKLKDRSLLVREERALGTAKDRLKPFQSVADSLRREFPIDTAFLSPKALEDLPNRQMIERSKQILDTFATEVAELAQALDKTIDKASDGLKDLDAAWSVEKMNAQKVYEQLLRELQKDRIDGSEFIKLKEQMEGMRPIQERLAVLERTLAEQRASRSALLAEWTDLCGEEFRRFEKAAKRISRELKNSVKVSVSAAANREPFDSLLKQELGGRLQETLARISNDQSFTLATFAEACRQGKQALVERFRIPPSQAENLASMPPGTIMQIEELYLPALTTIALNTAAETETPNWQNLDSLSTGQKATAVLLLLLLDSDAPLVIDQPEDDLDNRFISDGIVPKMREEKLKRQFIFATHNANIPVLGDAELILALTPNGEEGASILPEDRGSIDDATVRSKVEEILEGGREAFERRRRVYGH